MKPYNFLLQKAFFPLVGRVTKRKFWDAYQQVTKTQRLTADELGELQLKKLKKLVEHAYENVPYYRELFDQAGLTPVDIKTLKDLAKLPLTTKADLREAGLERTVAKNHKDFGTYKDSTSGSTGAPFQFLGDIWARDLSTAYTIRSWNWGGYEVGDPYVSLWGYHKQDFSNKLYNRLMRNTYLSAFDLDVNFERYVADIRRIKPRLITAYTSSMVKFAKMLEAAGITDVHIPIVIPTSENLYPHQRELIEKTVRGIVLDRYGSRELGAVAGECKEQDGLHINAETYFVEYVPTDPKSKHSRLVVTHLDKFGMPLIRYDTGDLGTPGNTKACGCGLHLPKIGSIEGRTTDFIKLKSGTLVPYLFFNYSLEQYGSMIKQFQVSQPNYEKIIVRVVPTAEFDTEKQHELAEKLEDALSGETKVSVEAVTEIPLSKSGKFVIVDTKMPL